VPPPSAICHGLSLHDHSASTITSAVCVCVCVCVRARARRVCAVYAVCG
jgi:hypothetical protein